MWTRTDETGRIVCTTIYEKYADEEMQDLDIFPEDFDFGKQYDYRIVDGELVYDPLPDPPEVQLNNLKAQLAATNDLIVQAYEDMLLGKDLDDETATKYAETLANRETWRQQIAELEAEIAEVEQEETSGGE